MKYSAVATRLSGIATLSILFTASPALAIGTWSMTDPMANPRQVHTATLLNDGDVLVVAGSRTGDGNGFTTSAERYHPSTETWSDAGSISSPSRYGHIEARLPDGKVLIAGGSDGSGNRLSAADVYDPSTNTWTPIGPMNHARRHASATLMNDGRVLVAGGLGSSNFVLEAEIYDPTTGLWTTTGSLTYPHYEHPAVLLNDGRVMIVGGVPDSGIPTDAEIYDPVSGTWSNAGVMNDHRSYHTATTLDDGRVLVVGGNNQNFETTDTAEIYDPTTDTWTPTTSLTTERFLHSATKLSDGTVMVVGGSSNGTPLTADIFDPASETWTATSLNMGYLYFNHTATLLADDRVLVAGGYNGANGYLAAARLYTPEQVAEPLELSTNADSFVRNGQDNRNEGANPRLIVQSSGHQRAVAAFDSASIIDYVAENGISSAKLVFTIATNGNNWGASGRTVDAHPLLAAFSEGNGKDQGLPNAQSTRGTGSGVTWNCAVDTNIQNATANCLTQWNGGTFGTSTAPSNLIVNSQTGEVEWDVTADVLAGSYSWLIKKTNEGQNGSVEFYSKEGSAMFAPRLILTP